MPQQPLILASASPRRAELLRIADIPFEASPADVDESVLADEPAHSYVRRVAALKARTTAARYPGRVVVGADTVVVVDRSVLGKPAGPADARRMLLMLSGRTHRVLTGVCVVVGASADGAGSVAIEVAETGVEFSPLTTAEVDWYIGTGEPMDKAGAYGIQGRASRFVTRIDGSYTNVVGLPVALVARMCTAAGLLLS